MKCPVCKFQIEEDDVFCVNCGCRIPRCPGCGWVIERRVRFCPKDGTRIPSELLALIPDPDEEKALHSRIQWEREELEQERESLNHYRFHTEPELESEVEEVDRQEDEEEDKEDDDFFILIEDDPVYEPVWKDTISAESAPVEEAISAASPSVEEPVSAESSSVEEPVKAESPSVEETVSAASDSAAETEQETPNSAAKDENASSTLDKKKKERPQSRYSLLLRNARAEEAEETDSAVTEELPSKNEDKDEIEEFLDDEEFEDEEDLEDDSEEDEDYDDAYDDNLFPSKRLLLIIGGLIIILAVILAFEIIGSYGADSTKNSTETEETTDEASEDTDSDAGTEITEEKTTEEETTEEETTEEVTTEEETTEEETTEEETTEEETTEEETSTAASSSQLTSAQSARLEEVIMKSDSEYLTSSDLSGFTAWMCRLARNGIYARHGRTFNISEVQEYFDSCSWYVGLYSASTFDTSVLNEYEVTNQNFILAYENSLN